MSKETLLSHLQHDLQRRYSQKYGNVRIQFDELTPEGDSVARFQRLISDSLGIITRYYGTAEYEGYRHFASASQPIHEDSISET